MAHYAVQIIKNTIWQGAQEEFSNVYPIGDTGLNISDDWSGVAQALADIEASICSSSVVFDRYSVWNIASPAESLITDQGDLTGTGALAGDTPFYRECAIAFEFPISRSPVLRRRRWLRKWIHTCAYPTGTTSSNNAMSGKEPMPQAALDFLQANYVEQLLAFRTSDGAAFESPDGSRPSTGYAKRYIEHRQFHR